SAITSPVFILSPTFLCHFAITPSDMVSLILGIRTTSAILFYLSFLKKYVLMLVVNVWIIFLYIHVSIKLFNFRIRRLFGKFNRICYDLFYFRIQIGKPIVIGILLFNDCL